MKKYRNKLLTGLTMGVSTLLSTQLHAVDVDPRDYKPAPPGFDVLAVYAQHIDGQGLNDGNGDQALDEDEFDLSGNIGVLRYIKFVEWLGYTWDPQIVVPFGELDLDIPAAGVSDSSSGVGDPLLAATWWFLNDNESKQWAGLTPFISIPIGNYDEDSQINIGENRYSFILQAGYVKGFGDKFTWDTYAEVQVFGDNDEFNLQGTVGELEQDESWLFQTNVAYDVSPLVQLSARLSYRTGGERTFDGADLDDKVDRTYATLGTAFQVNPTNQLLFQYLTDVDVENSAEVDEFRFRWVHVFPPAG